MDLSDIGRTERPEATADDADDDRRWHELLGQIGSEVAGPLTTAVERVNQLATTGRIDRQALRSLRAELEQARRAGMIGQQLARYASGRVRQSHERVDLPQVVRDCVSQRGREAEARGVEMRQALKPAEVIVDPTLLFALVNALLDWALALARSPIELKLDRKTWPANARLSVGFCHCPPDEAASAAPADGALDTLPWRLAQQIGATMGLPIDRRDDASRTAVAIEFPRTVNEEMEGASAIELDTGDSAFNSKPLAGSHVLIVAPRREMRSRAREAIRQMGLIIDFVASVDEARAFCRDGLPHAIVYAASLGGERFEALRAEIERDAPGFVFIEIVEQGQAYEVTGFGGARGARVGFDAIETGLPSALLFELSKNL
jgi:hypothetical protein